MCSKKKGARVTLSGLFFSIFSVKRANLNKETLNALSSYNYDYALNCRQSNAVNHRVTCF